MSAFRHDRNGMHRRLTRPTVDARTVHISFEEYGVARDALTDGWFAGPAYAAWQRMGNLQKWGA